MNSACLHSYTCPVCGGCANTRCYNCCPEERDHSKKGAMPEFDIEAVYAYEAWEMPDNMIEFTVRTSNGDVTGVITKHEAAALVDRLFECYPHWRSGTIAAAPRSMTE